MQASVTRSFTRAIVDQLPALGVELDPQLQLQLSLHEPGQRLPLAQQDALWQQLERHGDHSLGLKIGLGMLPQHFDTTGFLLLSSPSLSVAVESLVNYSSLIGEGGSFQKSHTALGWKITYTDLFSVAVALRIEAIFASIANGAQWVAGKPIAPLLVKFKHAKSATDELYKQAFKGAALEFNQNENAIVYATSEWHFRQREVNPAVQTQMLELAQQQLNQLQHRSLYERAQGILLQQPWLSRVDVAANLAVSERTLARHLKAHGTSFNDLSQAVKRQHALEKIQQLEITQAQLAEYLGYSDEQAFAKAFKRWTGMGFWDYRSQQAAVPATRDTL
ncbi:HTH-type transcriptional regulator VirS [Pseudidiomarina piscicola]|uniref:HTH-type transcriptional regulator VirS n=1 Tax=Pseudidiomarina piscicola TaxID=2614830 RepID=A0A6S6WLM2_9GAMM|nr:AraC family transcriptional regulator [Pseudidiomarina piscicola]CAB0150146.1 HTH-type transcriptional regulator VirS [Pseudidiomarina piscicola]VZT39585.1 HTH-type transcriptional regulator VirS [Pseudomonas aeruginosa]